MVAKNGQAHKAGLSSVKLVISMIGNAGRAPTIAPAIMPTISLSTNRHGLRSLIFCPFHPFPLAARLEIGGLSPRLRLLKPLPSDMSDWNSGHARKNSLWDSAVDVESFVH
jgi:hypothetical protein